MNLESPNEKGKYLSVDIEGNVKSTNDSGVHIDNIWEKIRSAIPNKFYIVSKKYNLFLDYNPRLSGEKIWGKPYSDTLWESTDDNEFYTIDQNGDKRYLWSLTDEVFVIPDEQLAEKWTPVSLEGYADFKDVKDNSPCIWVILFIVILFIVILKRS